MFCLWLSRLTCFADSVSCTWRCSQLCIAISHEQPNSEMFSFEKILELPWDLFLAIVLCQLFFSSAFVSRQLNLVLVRTMGKAAAKPKTAPGKDVVKKLPRELTRQQLLSHLRRQQPRQLPRWKLNHLLPRGLLALRRLFLCPKLLLSTRRTSATSWAKWRGQIQTMLWPCTTTTRPWESSMHKSRLWLPSGRLTRVASGTAATLSPLRRPVPPRSRVLLAGRQGQLGTKVCFFPLLSLIPLPSSGGKLPMRCIEIQAHHLSRNFWTLWKAALRSGMSLCRKKSSSRTKVRRSTSGLVPVVWPSLKKLRSTAKSSLPAWVATTPKVASPRVEPQGTLLRSKPSTLFTPSSRRKWEKLPLWVAACQIQIC